MQEKTRKVYPYVALDHKGEFQSLGVQSYPTTDSVSDSYIYIGLPPVEMTVQVPDDAQLVQGALALVGAEEEKLRRELQGKLIFLQQVKNGLLRLEHVEVLDPVDKPKAKPFATPGPLGDFDDDTPF